MITQIVYQCNECGEETFVSVNNNDIVYANDIMVERGWWHVDRKNNIWLCPECCVDCEE